MLRDRKTSTVHIGVQPQNLSFSGCGFLGIYHVGVASCFKQHAPGFIKNLKRVYGCSAGSLIGAVLLSDVCCGDICRSTLDIVRNVRSRYLGALSPGFSAKTVVLDGLIKILPKDAHEKCSGKLFISLTRVSDMKNIIVSEYSTRDELIDALVCSSFVPIYSGLFPPKYRGTRYVDGGLTNNLPAGSDTITVSPWSGGSDICPRDDAAINPLDVNIANTSVQMTVRNLHRVSTMFFPPESEAMSEFCKQGFREALRYLKEHGLFETVNPTMRSMSFSGELELAEKKSLSHRLSMSSKWISMQSSSNLQLEELVWEEEDDTSSKYSDEGYLVMKAGNLSDTSSTTSESTESTELVSDDEKYDANHNQEKVDGLVVDKQVLISNTYLPIAIIVDMSFAMDDIQSVLHLNFPQVMLQALEESYLDKNSRWYFPITKIASIWGKPVILAKLPIDKSYSLAILILRNISSVPENFKWLLSFLSFAVQILEKKFQAKSTDLVSKLRNAKDHLTDDLKLLSRQLCILVQIIFHKLLSQTSIDLSWVFKLVGGDSTFCKIKKFLAL